MNNNLIAVKNLKKNYLLSRTFRSPLAVQAIRGVELELQAHETLAVVGESGCGKSTLAKLLLKLETPDEGEILVGGKSLSSMSSNELSQTVQIIFQDPNSSLNPRKKIRDLIMEPMKIAGIAKDECLRRLSEVMNQVGLREDFLDRYPHMLSGGQKQRVGIARALVMKPKIMICDEPVSALDVSVQAQVLNLLLDLQKKYGLSYIFISHDLAVVRFLATRVAVLYLGQIVEVGSAEKIFSKPTHPYTQLLLESIPEVGKLKEFHMVDTQELPSPLNPPSGCGFRTRCQWAIKKCELEAPILELFMERKSACHRLTEINGLTK